jgi:hypothetical protein
MKETTAVIQDTLDGLPRYSSYDLGVDFVEHFEALSAEHGNRGINSGTYVPDESCTYEDFSGQQRPYKACYMELPGGSGNGETAYLKLGVHGNELVCDLTGDGFTRAVLRNPDLLRMLGYDRAILFHANPQRLNTWASLENPSPYDYLRGAFRGNGYIDHDYPVTYRSANKKSSFPTTRVSEGIIQSYTPLTLLSGHNSTIGAGGIYLNRSFPGLTKNLGRLFRETLPDVMPFGSVDFVDAPLFDNEAPGIFPYPSYAQRYAEAEEQYPGDKLRDHLPNQQSINYAGEVAREAGRKNYVGINTEVPYFALSGEYYGSHLIPDAQQQLVRHWERGLEELNRTIAFQQEYRWKERLDEFSPKHRLLARYAMLGASNFVELATSELQKARENSEPCSRTELTAGILLSDFYAYVPVGTTVRIAGELGLGGYKELDAHLQAAAGEAQATLQPTYNTPHKLARVQTGTLLYVMAATTEQL